MPAVSVITPIFNVQEFLPQCLDSLLAQTLDDVEFICVNDGSTDSSGEVLRSYAARDSRIKVIEKANSGYGATMNVGLDAAQGEYIAIVESDDFIAADGLERLYGLARLNGRPDIVTANFYRFNARKGEKFVENFKESCCGQVMSPAGEHVKAVFDRTPAIWSSIYRRDFIEHNGIRFLESPGASYQDTGFVFKSLIAADSIYITHDAFLRYRIDNAQSSVKARGKAFCVCDEFESIERFAESRPDKLECLAKVLAKKKFATYIWNYRRLGEEFRGEFLERFSAEARAARDQGALDEQLFSENQWRNVNLVIDEPDEFAAEMRAKEEARARKRAAKAQPKPEQNLAQKTARAWKKGGPREIARLARRRIRRGRGGKA